MSLKIPTSAKAITISQSPITPMFKPIKGSNSNMAITMKIQPFTFSILPPLNFVENIF